MGSHCDTCINDASGVDPKAAPCGRDSRIGSIDVRGIDAGEPGGGEPPRRVSGGPGWRERGQWCEAPCRAVPRQCRQWVRQSRRRQCTGPCTKTGVTGGAPTRSVVRQPVMRRLNDVRVEPTAAARQRDAGGDPGGVRNRE
ncbi:MAG: hypothetical protein OXQ29_25510 [Rhodospirillaceae bacterium]|nr:hypothetical protein [Rhodospirillaceae bacterium]